MWEDGEGGNLSIYSPNGQSFNFDAYDNESLRLFRYDNGGAFHETRFNRDGSIHNDGSIWSSTGYSVERAIGVANAWGNLYEYINSNGGRGLYSNEHGSLISMDKNGNVFGAGGSKPFYVQKIRAADTGDYSKPIIQTRFFDIYDLSIPSNSHVDLEVYSYGGALFIGMVGNVGGDIRGWRWNSVSAGATVPSVINGTGDVTWLKASFPAQGVLRLSQGTNGTSGILIVANYSRHNYWN